MSEFNIQWSVTEVVSGNGDDVHDGDRRVVASGEIVKTSGSAGYLKSELTALLERSYPRHQLRGTYDIDCVYDIKISEIKEEFFNES